MTDDLSFELAVIALLLNLAGIVLVIPLIASLVRMCRREREMHQRYSKPPGKVS